MYAHFSNLLTTLDKHQDSMPEGAYLELCNALKATKEGIEGSLDFYRIKFVTTGVRTNQDTVSTVYPRISNRIVNPTEFFPAVDPSYLPHHIEKIQDAIAREGYALAVHGRSGWGNDNSIVNVYWEDEAIGEPVHVRLDKSREVIILDIHRVTEERPKKARELTLTLEQLQELVTQVENGEWHLETNSDEVSSICDSDGRPQLIQGPDGRLARITYEGSTGTVNNAVLPDGPVTVTIPPMFED